MIYILVSTVSECTKILPPSSRYGVNVHSCSTAIVGERHPIEFLIASTRYIARKIVIANICTLLFPQLPIREAVLSETRNVQIQLFDNSKVN